MSTDKTAGRVPPNDLDAESAVLGSMLLERDAISLTVGNIGENSFYAEKNRIIFETIVKLYDQNQPVDIVTVIDDLKKRNALDLAGGTSYIAELSNAVPTAANVEYYAKIVREKSILRNLLKATAEISSEAYAATVNPDDILDSAEKAIFDITSTRRKKAQMFELKDVMKEAIEKIDKLNQRKAHITGIPTGFHDLDLLTAGLQPSDFVVVAARPSMGKSAFVSCILEHCAVVDKVPCVFFSLEMSKEQFGQRMLCSYARMDAQKVRTGWFSQSDWPKLMEAADRLSRAPIYIDDTPALSALEIRARARRLKATKDIQLVVIDYIQLMRSSTRSENRQAEISDISRSIKALARELSIPVIGISQLSRLVEQREKHKPMLSDLRESGAIEQDADVVMMLFREEYYEQNTENKGIAEVIIAKHRNGPTDTIKLAWLPEYTKFANLSRAEQEPGF